MRTLTGRYDDDVFEGPAVGLVVLQSDVVIERELRRWLPDDVALLHTRIANDTTVSAQTLTAMEARLPASVALLPDGVRYGVIAYGCTSASTLIGESRVEELIGGVLPGVPVTNPLSALKAWLRDQGLTRIGLLTPYVPAVSQAIVDSLVGDGITVSQVATFDQPDDRRVALLSPASVRDALIELAAHDECDAVFGSCTNLRADGVLDDVRRIGGKPAMTSNAALAWHIRTLLNP